MKTRYVFTSLKDVAQELDRRANLIGVQMGRSKHEREVNNAHIRGLREAEDLLKNTDLEPEDKS
jgi:hypothetical protein